MKKKKSKKLKLKKDINGKEKRKKFKQAGTELCQA